MRENIALDIGDCACSVAIDVDGYGNCAGGRGRRGCRNGGEGDESRESLEIVSETCAVVEKGEAATGLKIIFTNLD